MIKSKKDLQTPSFLVQTTHQTKSNITRIFYFDIFHLASISIDRIACLVTVVWNNINKLYVLRIKYVFNFYKWLIFF